MRQRAEEKRWIFEWILITSCKVMAASVLQSLLSKYSSWTPFNRLGPTRSKGHLSFGSLDDFPSLILKSTM